MHLISEVAHAPSTFSALDLLYGFLGVAAGLGGTLIFRGSRNKALAALQATAVASLQGELDAQVARADRLNEQCASLQKQIDIQHQQIKSQHSETQMLRDLVTQAAKVDDLTKTVIDAREKILARLPVK